MLLRNGVRFSGRMRYDDDHVHMEAMDLTVNNFSMNDCFLSCSDPFPAMEVGKINV
jgi:hypothetical protein